MTPQEKAKEIVEYNWKCYPKKNPETGEPDYSVAKTYGDLRADELAESSTESEEYWEKVKQEIKNYGRI